MKKFNFKKIVIKGVRMGLGFLILITLYFVGDFLSALLPFPVPGSVIGLLLIFLLLYTKVIRLQWVDDAASLLLAFLGVFYVPYGVGIIEANDAVKERAGLILLVIAVVTISVLFFSGKLFSLLGQKKKKGNV